MKRIIIILAFLVCGISSAQQYFFNGTVYVPKTTVQINAIVSPPEGRTEANSDTGSLWYFDGTIWKDTFVGVSSFADLEGDPYDNAMLSDALNSKANDSEVVKINPNSLVTPLTLAVSDSTTIASGIFSPNTVVIDTTTRTPGGDEFVTGGSLSGAGVLTLNRNYGSPIQIPGFSSGGGGTVSWGGIGGNPVDQIDMMNLFSGKAGLSLNNNFIGNNTFTAPINIGPTIPAGAPNMKINSPSGTIEFNKPVTKSPFYAPNNGYGSIRFGHDGSFIISDTSDEGVTRDTRFIFGSQISKREYQFQDRNGTIAFLDDIPAGGNGDMLKSENLSGLANYATARTNLGIGNVNNTSDANKPISTATQAALNGKGGLSTNNTWTETNEFTKPVTMSPTASPFNLQNINVVLPGNLLEANRSTIIVGGSDPAGQATLNFNPSGTLRPLTASDSDIKYNGTSLLPRTGATGSFTSQDGKTITVTNGLITNISTP